MGISSGIGSTVGALPAGSVIPFAGSSAPANWLLCAGQAVSRTDYGALFAVIGTTYGSGNGSTTFNVPDLRGRVVAGIDNMGGSAASRLTSTTITGGADAAGEVGGAQTHQLTTSEMPSHSHSSPTTKSTVGGTGVYYGQGADVQGQSTGTTGGDAAHNNVQPTMVMNYIIKATAL